MSVAFLIIFISLRERRKGGLSLFYSPPVVEIRDGPYRCNLQHPSSTGDTNWLDVPRAKPQELFLFARCPIAWTPNRCCPASPLVVPAPSARPPALNNSPCPPPLDRCFEHQEWIFALHSDHINCFPHGALWKTSDHHLLPTVPPPEVSRRFSSRRCLSSPLARPFLAVQ